MTTPLDYNLIFNLNQNLYSTNYLDKNLIVQYL